MREFETLEVTRPLLVVVGGFTDMCVLYDSLCFKKGLEKERGGGRRRGSDISLRT